MFYCVKRLFWNITRKKKTVKYLWTLNIYDYLVTVLPSSRSTSLVHLVWSFSSFFCCFVYYPRAPNILREWYVLYWLTVPVTLFSKQSSQINTKELTPSCCRFAKRSSHKWKSRRMTGSPAPGGRACDFKATNWAFALSGIKNPVWIKGKGSHSPWTKIFSWNRVLLSKAPLIPWVLPYEIIFLEVKSFQIP